ncbi:MAG: CTP pyrophosphohydrolase [Treponema sp. GWB1_62_6]|nr:MAG: CTP pyrophosphohydrolase [Treponema sp. GWA1_62_8]OHE64600.1 MAG: CTP pyrophosphohydrolase [Treponema sp. GWB1_62_6]OHE69254.1 MAG: CTP pyrophosphohydrolase [Treponema sp. GWC1_61_84]OHE75266.1 MAG: CTP pyrophosphohydrolase [Treponema sp. RIFOXYC1_FULL_61_9]HCM25970.1 CTP pyrophosphohydrolase [Treponema sp.]
MKRSVAGIVRNGEFLLVAHRLPGGSLGGKWEFPGGKVEAGESDRQTIAREFDEEFAVQAVAGALLATADFEHSGDYRALSAYEVTMSSFDLTLAEHSEWRWAKVEEILRMDFADSDLKLIGQLRERLGL